MSEGPVFLSVPQVSECYTEADGRSDEGTEGGLGG
jgi:hypothetical protein